MTRRLLLNPEGIVDTATGEVHDSLSTELLLRNDQGGVIAGRNMYPHLAELVDTARKDHGWSAKIHCQEQRTSDPKKLRGIIYISHLTYRYPKESSRLNGKRTYSRKTVKWLVMNLELFSESRDIDFASESLLRIATSRGISPRYSPGSFGSALLRASPEWENERRPAPWFISEAARKKLPGNYYATRHGYRKAKTAYYIDQSSAHHTVASQIDMPHPHYLRARGRFRMVEADKSPIFYDDPVELLQRHIGVIIARVTCGHIPISQSHLYPKWARQHGSHVRWIWTPELRLLDHNIRIEYGIAALTSVRADPALREYAKWSINELSKPHDPSVKPALLSAYGMLAVKPPKSLKIYSAHGREKPPRADIVTLPLLDRVFRSTVNATRVPSIQNVVARGVIEAEVMVRSIQLARSLESHGHRVVHIYADGLIVEGGSVPFLPPDWRISSFLTNVTSPAPHSILSNELTRLPGIPNGRRTAYIRQDSEGFHLREMEPPVSAASVIYSDD